MSGTITISEKYVRKYDQQSAGRATLVQQTTTTDLTSEQIDKLNTAYDLRLQWDGGATNLVAATGRTSLDVYSKGEGDGRYLQQSNNLSDLANAGTARGNLNVLEAGTASGQIRTNTQLDDRYGRLATENTWLENNTFNENVGIGTTSIYPTIKLQVERAWDGVGTTRNNAAIWWGKAVETNDIFGWLAADQTNKKVLIGTREFGVGHPDLSLMSDGGNVAIGKTSVTEGYLFDVNGKGIFQDDLTVKANLGTDNWVSETTGWRQTYAGHLDTRSIFTDQMVAKAFIADLDLALLSGHMVTKSVTQVSRNFTVVAVDSTVKVYVEALPGFPTSQVFADGDWIRFQVIERGEGLKWLVVWATVNATTFTDEGDGEQSYTVTIKDAGALGAAVGEEVYAGGAAQDFGQSGDGFIQQEAAATYTDSDRPWLQVATWTDINPGGPSNTDNIAVRGRFGNLEGITGQDGFGLVTRKDNTNYVTQWWNTDSDWGIRGAIAGNTHFQLGSTNNIAGWTFDNEKLYKGTNIVLDAANERISLAGGAMAFGYEVATGKHGLRIDGENYWYSNKAFRAHVDSSNYIDLAGGLDIRATTFRLDAGQGDLKIDSVAKRISIRNDTFGSSGIQLEYFQEPFEPGMGKIYAGDGSDKFIKFDGINAEVSGKITAGEGAIAGWDILTTEISKVGGTDDKEKVILSSAERYLVFQEKPNTAWIDRVTITAGTIPLSGSIHGTHIGRDGVRSYWGTETWFVVGLTYSPSLQMKGSIEMVGPGDIVGAGHITMYDDSSALSIRGHRDQGVKLRNLKSTGLASDDLYTKWDGSDYVVCRYGS